MAKYLYVYYGGMSGGTPAEQEKSMKAWTAWFTKMGKAVVDMGTPTGPGKKVTKNSVRAVGANPVTGYSVIQASNIDKAADMAKDCPIMDEGGSIAIYEALPM
jgi:hypothetical protein